MPEYNNDLEKVFEFIQCSGTLKKLERFRNQYYWKDYPEPESGKYESVADHTWRLILIVLVLEKQLKTSFDLVKMLKMAVIHDLPEIFAGDESPLGKSGTGNDSHAFNEEKAEQRHITEKEAAERLFSLLPKEEYEELYDLWLEYEEQKSPESRILKSLDKMEAFIQVLEYRKGHMFKDHLEFTIKYGQKGSEVDDTLDKFGKLIEEKMRKEFKEFKKS